MSILGEESFHVPEMALDFGEVGLGGIPPPLGKQALDGGCIEAVFHHFGRHAYGDGIGGYVASDHRTGTDHTPSPMVTPSSTVTLAPIKTSLPTWVRLVS